MKGHIDLANPSCTETLNMVAAALNSVDRFAAGRLLGRAILDRVRLTGDESIIGGTHSALQVVSQPAQDELIDGFAKAIYFGVYVDRRTL